MAVMIAGAGHDADHDGFTNQFHVQTEHRLAILYNGELATGESSSK